MLSPACPRLLEPAHLLLLAPFAGVRALGAVRCCSREARNRLARRAVWRAAKGRHHASTFICAVRGVRALDWLKDTFELRICSQWAIYLCRDMLQDKNVSGALWAARHVPAPLAPHRLYIALDTAVRLGLEPFIAGAADVCGIDSDLMRRNADYGSAIEAACVADDIEWLLTQADRAIDSILRIAGSTGGAALVRRFVAALKVQSSPALADYRFHEAMRELALSEKVDS